MVGDIYDGEKLKRFRDILLRPGLLPHLYKLSRMIFWDRCGWQNWEDLAQEALMRAWEAGGSFKGRDEADFIGWFLSILRNYSRDLARKYGTIGIEFEDDILEIVEKMGQTASAEDELIRNEEANQRRFALEKALTKLPAKQQAVIFLTFLYGQDTKETAKLLGMSIRTAQALRSKAIARLQRQIGGLRLPTI
jgi:RNA polymerase sigma factor (sigma-70 family)